MFKESATDKLIEYILSLPQDEQNVIAKKIKDSAGSSSKEFKKRLKHFVAFTDKATGRLPKNYKFNRDEANER